MLTYSSRSAGILYCTHSSNYDCIAAYNLSNPSTWVCEAESALEEEENMDTGSTNNDAFIFENYPWLLDVIDANDCEGVTISTYITGIYQYLLVETPTDSKLYNQDGALYCTNTSNYDCVAAYNLSAPSIWNCVDVATNEEEPSEEEPSTTISAIFEDYAWLGNYIMNLADCEGASVTVYDIGSHQFLLVQTPFLGEQLFLGDGTFYCSSTSTYDCTAAYRLLEEQITATWACGEQGLVQPTEWDIQAKVGLIPSQLAVFPNPVRYQLIVQLPIRGDNHTEQLLELVDITGQSVWLGTASNATTSIDVQHLAKGIYFLNWSTSLEQQTIRVVVE